MCQSQFFLKSMMKTVQREGDEVLLELHQLQLLNGNPESEDEQVNSVIEEVFNIPSDLSPLRSPEHAIILKEGTSPISVRPYRRKTKLKSLSLRR